MRFHAPDMMDTIGQVDYLPTDASSHGAPLIPATAKGCLDVPHHALL